MSPNSSYLAYKCIYNHPITSIEEIKSQNPNYSRFGGKASSSKSCNIHQEKGKRLINLANESDFLSKMAWKLEEEESERIVPRERGKK